MIYARQGGRWLHARIRDEPSEEAPRTSGSWTSNGCSASGSTRATTGSCPPPARGPNNGNFLLRDFDVKVEGRIALSGTQRIGWDAQREQFRMWVFDDGGGFAEGLMSRDGDRWVVQGSGVRSDGQSVSFTNAITPLGKDRLRWEILDRTVGGEAMPDTDRFDLVRRPPGPGK